MSSLDVGAERLVGRGPELAQLLHALERVGGGAGGGVALVGEAGVGKSRLSRELLAASRAAQVPTLVGRAVSTASAVPYRAVRESLLSWARSRPVPAAEQVGGYGRGVEHLLDDSGAEGQRLSPVFVAESYLRVLSAIAGGTGCVVLLEDLHWADDETLAVVEYVADHADSAGVLLVVTSRYDAAATARPLLDALSARGSLRPLRLSPLDAGQVGELTTQLLGGPASPALVELLHKRSEGVPLLVEELVSALRELDALTPGPAGIEASDAAARVLPGSVAETVRVRLDTLPPPQRRALETAAVFGRAFEWRRLAPVAGLDDDAVLESLRAANAATVLEPDPVRPGELRFRHALIRDAVSAATFPPERTLLARRALDELMATAGPEGRDEDLALAIELAAQCDDHATAARLALRLAWRAMMGWSLATAERRLAQARRHAETDPELLVDIDVLQIRVASMVGRIDVVRTVGGALLARVDDNDPGTRLETHLQLGQVAAEDGDWTESERQLDAAEPLLARAADPCHLTRHALWSAVRAGQAGATDEARGHALRAIELAAPHDDQVDLTCAALLHLGRLALPDVDEARAKWQHALRLATDHDLRLWRGRLLAELAGPAVLDLGGDAELEESLALAHEAGAVELAQRVELMRAELALLRGDTEEAERRLDAAEAVTGPSAVVASTRDRAHVLRALVAAVRGAGSAAGGAAVGSPTRAARAAPGTVSATSAPATVSAIAALLRDDLAGAAELAREVEETSTGPLGPYAALLSLLPAAPATHADGGDPDVPPVAHPSGAVGGHPSGAVGRGLDTARRARDTATAVPRDATTPTDAGRAAALLVEAATTLRPAPLLAAFAVRLAAPAVISAGAGEQVRDLLREAAATLDRHELSRSADACRALLRDSGVAVPRRTSAQAGVPDQLRALGVTGRELEVLRLVAEGLTSREIAERLYLSHRTVEKHVERLLTKTGAANRTALAGFAPAT